MGFPFQVKVDVDVEAPWLEAAGLELESDLINACGCRHVIAGIGSDVAGAGVSVVILPIEYLRHVIGDVLYVDPVLQKGRAAGDSGHVVIRYRDGAAVRMRRVRKSAPADDARLPQFGPEIALLCSAIRALAFPFVTAGFVNLVAAWGSSPG
jgi:hypothetical protein